MWTRVLALALFGALLFAADATRLSVAEKQAVLDKHNELRCFVSPAASDMTAMVWDAELEAVAQAWADTCPDNHNPDRSTQYGHGYVGENMAWGYLTFPSAVEDGWYSEVANYNFGANTCSGVCGHYTQVVWAGSTKLGCATPTQTNCADYGDDIYVCNYFPGGNIGGARPYTAGAGTNPACSAGGPGSQNDPHFAGFHGQLYDVTGEENVPYLWYSDVDINVVGVMTRNPENKKIYMTKAAIRFGAADTAVVFSPLPNYELGRNPFHENGTLDDCGRTFWNDNQTLVIQWHSYTITLKTMRPEAGSADRQHINLGMSSIARNPDTVQGLLGDSHRPGKPVANTLRGEGVLEAELAAYALRDGVFGTDSKMNRFVGAAGALTPAQCAALLASPKTLETLTAGSFEGTH